MFLPAPVPLRYTGLGKESLLLFNGQIEQFHEREIESDIFLKKKKEKGECKLSCLTFSSYLVNNQW